MNIERRPSYTTHGELNVSVDLLRLLRSIADGTPCQVCTRRRAERVRTQSGHARALCSSCLASRSKR